MQHNFYKGWGYAFTNACIMCFSLYVYLYYLIASFGAALALLSFTDSVVVRSSSWTEKGRSNKPRNDSFVGWLPMLTFWIGWRFIIFTLLLYTLMFNFISIYSIVFGILATDHFPYHLLSTLLTLTNPFIHWPSSYSLLDECGCCLVLQCYLIWEHTAVVVGSFFNMLQGDMGLTTIYCPIWCWQCCCWSI